jgi:acetyl esterase/lipase
MDGAFYGPTDYEDPFWAQPNLPFNHNPIPPPDAGYDHLYEGLHDEPVVGYSPHPSLRSLGGWMSLDDPRSRIILHMNWEGKSLPILINGLNRTGTTRPKRVTHPSTPSVKQIREVSPLAQIRAGNYKTPTFLIHGTRDDLVPWEASQRTHRTLLENGVPTGLAILEDALHLFDIYPGSKRKPDFVKAVKNGFDFLAAHV